MSLISLTRPQPATLPDDVGSINYPASGSTNDGAAPRGYRADSLTITLGHGRDVFTWAREAMRTWRPFDLSWVTIRRPDGPPESGSVVTVIARVAFLWFLTRCRVVDVIDSEDRFAFSYATLPHHVMRGEEMFEVRYDPATTLVTYRIEAHSRPAHPLVWLGLPVARLVQRRFRKHSGDAMLRAVHIA